MRLGSCRTPCFGFSGFLAFSLSGSPNSTITRFPPLRLSRFRAFWLAGFRIRPTYSEEHEEVRNKQPSVDLKALHFELSGFPGSPISGSPRCIGAVGRAALLKGCLTWGCFPDYGLSRFLDFGRPRCPCSGRTGRRPRETLEPAHYRSTGGGI